MSATEQLQQQEQQAPPEEQIEAPELEEAPEPEQQEQAPPATPSEVEEIAREMGWAPKTEWKGPAESWKSAKEFIRHGTVIQRELKSRNDQQARDFEERISRLDRANQKALTNQRASIVAHYESQKEAAASIGDMSAYNAAKQAEREALKNFDEEVADVIPPQQQQNGKANPHGAPPEVLDFAMRNGDWFDKDPVMTGAALALNAAIGRDHPHLSIADKLTLVENEIKRRFPNGTQQQGQNGNNNGQQQRGGQVEGGLRPIKTNKLKDWSSLPAEAKSAGTKQIKEGLFKDQADYATNYWAQE